MAQLIVRNLDDSIESRLRERATRLGKSMEAEVRDIPRGAAAERHAAIVTHNTRHFHDLGTSVIDPWQEISP